MVKNKIAKLHCIDFQTMQAIESILFRIRLLSCLNIANKGIFMCNVSNVENRKKGSNPNCEILEEK